MLCLGRRERGENDAYVDGLPSLAVKYYGSSQLVASTFAYEEIRSPAESEENGGVIKSLRILV